MNNHVAPFDNPTCAPVPFDNPTQVYQAEKHFEFLDQDGRMIKGYLRRADADHEFAYTYFGKPSYGETKDGRRSILTGAKYVRGGDGRYRFNEDYVVIKKLSKDWIRRNPNVSENVETEIAAATLLEDDEHVHRIIEVLEDRSFKYIVMPHLGFDFYETFIVDNDALDQNRLAFDEMQFTRALVKDLIYLKENNVIHRDLSLENIIVDFASGGRVCLLIDFAMALRCQRNEGIAFRIEPQNLCGKFPYMSPEVYCSTPLDFGVDVWALGCIFFYVFTGEWKNNESENRHEFRGQHLYEIPGDRCWQYYINGNGLAEARQRNFDGYLNRPGFPADYFREVKLLPVVQRLTDDQRDLLCQMLQVDPENRILVEEILQHPYFQNDLAR
ncbi:protein kinase [Fragilaria crotonensis]|nr:protein kinase [Fragilaria crotonensis]